MVFSTIRSAVLSLGSLRDSSSEVSSGLVGGAIILGGGGTVLGAGHDILRLAMGVCRSGVAMSGAEIFRRIGTL